MAANKTTSGTNFVELARNLKTPEAIQFLNEVYKVFQKTDITDMLTIKAAVAELEALLAKQKNVNTEVVKIKEFVHNDILVYRSCLEIGDELSQDEIELFWKKVNPKAREGAKILIDIEMFFRKGDVDEARKIIYKVIDKELPKPYAKPKEEKTDSYASSLTISAGLISAILALFMI
jgi:hypothetical protein